MIFAALMTLIIEKTNYQNTAYITTNSTNMA